jgi:hypothetical protein
LGTTALQSVVSNKLASTIATTASSGVATVTLAVSAGATGMTNVAYFSPTEIEIGTNAANTNVQIGAAGVASFSPTNITIGDNADNTTIYIGSGADNTEVSLGNGNSPSTNKSILLLNGVGLVSSKPTYGNFGVATVLAQYVNTGGVTATELVIGAAPASFTGTTSAYYTGQVNGFTAPYTGFYQISLYITVATDDQPVVYWAPNYVSNVSFGSLTVEAAVNGFNVSAADVYQLTGSVYLYATSGDNLYTLIVNPSAANMTNIYIQVTGF